MALKTYNGSTFDDHLGSSSITATVVNTTLAGITSSGVTAPNLVNKANGCWIWVATIPTNGGNLTVEVMESGVAKALATINNADIQLGANYVRFATPYTFATLTASAYTARVKNTVGTSGQLRSAASGLWFQFTYDTATTLGTSDDLWVGGFNDAGLTPKQYTITGTSGTFGSKAATGIGSTTQTMGAAITCGSGGTVKYDQTASTTLTLKGSVYTTAGGVFDMRPPSGNMAIISTLIIDSTANGDQGLFAGTGLVGGQILTAGAVVNTQVQRGTGSGTAADPWIPATPIDSVVGDEVVFGGSTDYAKNETRYIKTRNSSQSFVLSSTPGGAEAALTQTHDATSYVGLMTRNSIVKPADITKGFYINNPGTYAVSAFDYTRFEYADNSSGKSCTFAFSNGATFDGIVMYNSPVSGRHCIALANTGSEATAARTYSNIILFNTQGGNFSGQSGIGFSGTINKTFNNVLHFNGPAATSPGAMLSLNLSSNGNTFNNCHSYGANASNSSSGYAIGLFSSLANTFNNCTVNGARQNAVYSNAGADNVFNNCNFGTIGTNTVDVLTVSSSINKMLFSNCNFGSATRISNYLNQSDTSEVRFHAINGVAHKHEWYTNYGYAEATGAALSDTTVKTAGSYNVKINPQENVKGFSWVFNIKATVSQIAFIKGFLRKNATMGASVAKVELFLPGTLLTDTPDATFTASSTPDTYQDFVIGKNYSGSENTEAKVRITAISSTAGAAVYVANLYDSVDALNSWFEGKPSNLVVPTDFSSVPGLLWAYPDSPTTSGTMGRRQVDAAEDADVAANR